MTRILHPEYRNDVLEGQYPFTDDSTLQARSGMQLLPQALLDAVLHPPEHNLPQRLNTIVIADLVATFNLADDSGASCSGSIELTSPAGTIPLTDVFGRPAGLLLGDPAHLETLQSWPEGTHQFPDGTAEFVATVVIPCPELCVRGLQANGSTPLANDVWLVGEEGVILTEEAGLIRIDIVGEPLFVRELFSGNGSFQAPRVLKTINNIPPDAAGHFTIFPGLLEISNPALRIYADGANGLFVELAGA